MVEIRAVVETALYIDDLDDVEDFYRRILGLRVMGKSSGRHVFFQVGEASVLLAFLAEATLKGDHLPPHGAIGPGHIALGIEAESFDAWRKHLHDHGVAVEQEVEWPKGGTSLYAFRSNCRTSFSRHCFNPVACALSGSSRTVMPCPPGFWYDQDRDDWVVVLKGAARLRFEDRIVEMNPGDFINIPAHKRYRVEWSTPEEPTIWRRRITIQGSVNFSLSILCRRLLLGDSNN
jgi:catechol 2,3-dioxygenase-like lactoylglutathione lyase family enzyme